MEDTCRNRNKNEQSKCLYREIFSVLHDEKNTLIIHHPYMSWVIKDPPVAGTTSHFFMKHASDRKKERALPQKESHFL